MRPLRAGEVSCVFSEIFNFIHSKKSAFSKGMTDITGGSGARMGVRQAVAIAQVGMLRV